MKFNQFIKAGLLTLVSAVAIGFTPNASAQEEQVLKVASHMSPMVDVVEIAAKVIEPPYKIELMEVSDNIQYNEAVLNDEAYASFAQHEPFMEIFNKEKNGDLTFVQPIYNAYVGFYSPVYKSIEEIEDGAEVAIPSDITNEGRALRLLESNGLIKIDEKAGLFPQVKDVIENPKNLKFTNVDLLNLTASYEDKVPLVFNYPTYIAKLGLSTEDALMVEPQDDTTYAQGLVIRKGNVDSEATKALIKAFTSPEVKEFLADFEAKKHLNISFGKEDKGSESVDANVADESVEEASSAQ